jgi:hypothetical protein
MAARNTPQKVVFSPLPAPQISRESATRRLVLSESGVHRIVLTDMTRQVIIQPVELGNDSVETNSALRSANFSTAHAAFLMSDVESIRASDTNQEFFITVTGDRQNKWFRVKARFFKTLFN